MLVKAPPDCAPYFADRIQLILYSQGSWEVGYAVSPV